MSEEEYYEEEEPLDGEEEYIEGGDIPFEEGDLDESGNITADDVLQGGGGGFGGGFGNALAPALPEYLRNSLMPLDSWQSFEGDKETERQVKALEDQLTDIELQSAIDLKKAKESKFKLSKWHIMMIAGIATTLVAILFLIMKRVK